MFQSTLRTSSGASSLDGARSASQADAPPQTGDRGKGLHVGIIMDGNGRWAKRRGLPRPAGHRAGVPAVRRTIEAAPTHGIGTLTLYAFSSDNWQRPALEVQHLMRLFRTHLESEAERCSREGVRVSVIGRRDRLAPAVVAAIEAAEERTEGGRTLQLQIAVDYSGRSALLEAMKGAVHAAVREKANGNSPDAPDDMARRLARVLHAPDPIPDADLIIRTGGERRLSDFLVWESAYAELHFTPCLWPDFGEPELAAAMHDFHARERRFGGIPATTPPSAREA